MKKGRQIKSINRKKGFIGIVPRNAFVLKLCDPDDLYCDRAIKCV